MGQGGTQGPASRPSTAPAASQAPSSGPGGFLDRLFAGGADPRLSPEANQGVTQQALINAGLGTILSDEPGIGALAEGLAVGRQAAMGAKERLFIEQAQAGAIQKEREREEARARILTENDLGTTEGRIQTVQQLVAAGLGDDAQKIVNLMGTFEAPQVLTQGDRFRVFDPNTLEITDTGIKMPEPPKDTEFQQVGDNLVLIDKQTGEPIRAFQNPERLSTAELRSLANDAFKQTTQLRKEFQDISGKAQEALALADAALTGPEGDPATGQTLIIALNKILDPNSVVRESEFARVAEIGGITARLEGLQAQIEQGQLPASVEASVRAEIARLKEAMQKELVKQTTFFTGLAAQNNLNPDQVVRPGLQNIEGETPGAVNTIPADRREAVKRIGRGL